MRSNCAVTVGLGNNEWVVVEDRLEAQREWNEREKGATDKAS